MKTQIRLLLLTASLLAIAVSPLRAQVVADGATNTLNNVTNFFADDVTVGTNGSFTLLTLANNALLTNSGHGYLGRFAGANSNTLRLAGANTRWLMSGDSFAGRDGAGNQLLVSNGSVVRNHDGYIGYNSTSSSNAAVVTGASSLWTNEADVFVGFLGAGNQLVVSNAGVVRNSTGFLGFFSTGNAVVVTDAGSLWTNGNTLAVGYNGGGNQLLVSNGGLVRSHSGILGYGSTSSDNAAVVTGAGSLWTNAYVLYVGYNGAGNQLLVSNGGVVRNSIGRIGVNFASSSNVVVVTGAGSLWTNEFDLDVGFDGSGNQLVVSNGGRVGNADCYLGLYGGSNNLAVVSGAGSLWTMATNLYVGYNGGGNQVVVSNGGVVRDETCHLGYFSSKNLVVVTDAGSLWTNTYAFVVGTSGSGNQLVVTNGGVVRAKLGVVGSSNVSSNNVAVVTGAGSMWANEEEFYVGFNGRGNQLVVSNGGVVLTMDGYIGSANLGRDNAALVTGVGSRWTNAANLFVGEFGAGNRLVVSNGGAVWSTLGYLGYNSTSSSNAAVVTGTGSLWTNSGALTIGNFGSFNQLDVSAGGMVRAGGLVTLGATATATNNSVLAMGGSLASVGLRLGNSLSRNNSVTLLSGSVWDVGGGPFTWGNAGFNDTLTIDATSSLTNIGALTLDENSTAFHLTNASAGYTLNGFTTNQLQFKPTGGLSGFRFSGNQVWSQDAIRQLNTSFTSTSETGDRFGSALAAGDFNGDGRADLAVGVPGESVAFGGNTVNRAGEVDVIYGSALGLSPTNRTPQRFNQATTGIADNPETDDRFGTRLSAWNFGRNETITGPPPLQLRITVRTADLAIGVPNESVGSASLAGAVHVLYGRFANQGLTTTSAQFWTQNSPGVPGTSQAFESFGSALC